MYAVCVATAVSLSLPVGTAITTAVSATSNWQELSSCLYRASMIIKHFIIQLVHNI